MLTFLSFVFVLGVLIFVHELGHFLAAKAVGIGVPRFSIGLGPPTPLRFVRGETEYQVAWVPLGGYVKMASKEEQEMMAALEGGELEKEFPADKLFENKPLWARILTISAGVIMNILFAWLIYSGMALTYGEAKDPTTSIARVDVELLPIGAEALADLPPRAEVAVVNGEPVTTWNEILEGVLDPTSKALVLELEDGRSFTVDIPGIEANARGEIAGALIPNWPAKVNFVAPGKPADLAGLQTGDTIVAIGGEPIDAWDDLVAHIQGAAGEELGFTIDRDGEIVELTIVPALETVEDPRTRISRQVAQIGINPMLDTVRIRYGVVESLGVGAARTWENVGLILFTLKGMVTGGIPVKELGGPILIGQASGQMARAGFATLLLFMAFLSVNLAVLNLLPIPVLDGGHLIFLIAEGLRGGRPLPVEWRMRLTQAGLVVVFGLMILAISNDILRVLGFYSSP